MGRLRPKRGRDHPGLSEQVSHCLVSPELSLNRPCVGCTQSPGRAKKWTGYLEAVPMGRVNSPKQKQGAVPRCWQQTRLPPRAGYSLPHCPSVYPVLRRPKAFPCSEAPSCPLPPMRFCAFPAGNQEALQPHPRGDLPLLLAPPPDQQPHFLHSRAGKAPTLPPPGQAARVGVV